MKKVSLLLVIGLACCNMAIAQIKTFKKKDGFFIKDFTFSFDNDRIPPSNTDEDYTTGIRLQWRTKYLHLPIFLGFKNKKTQDNRTKIVGEENRNFSTFSNGIYYYTPTDLTRTTVDIFDRPYASFQYVAFGRYSDRKTLRGDFTTNSYERFESEIQIGLVGGPLAKNLQRWTHEILKGGSPVPEGWDNQIGGRSNRLAFNYALEYEVLWLDSGFRQKQKKKKYYDCHYYSLRQAFNLTAFANGNIGNLRSDFGFGLQLNIFNRNNQQLYSLDFFDPENHDFPAGSPPVLKIRDSSKLARPFRQFMKEVFSHRADTLPYNLKAMRYNAPQVALDAGFVQPFTYDEREEKNFFKRLNKRKRNRKNFRARIDGYLETMIHNVRADMESSATDSIRLVHEHMLDSLLTLSRIIQNRSLFWGDIRPFFDTGERFYNRRFSMNVFLRPEINYIAFNGMLQGLMFSDNSPHTIDIIKPFVFEGRVGINLKFDAFNFQYVYTFRSKEFDFKGSTTDPDRPQPKNWHSWGTLNLSMRPNMVSDWIRRTKFRRRVRRNAKKLRNIP